MNIRSHTAKSAARRSGGRLSYADRDRLSVASRPSHYEVLILVGVLSLVCGLLIATGRFRLAAIAMWGGLALASARYLLHGGVESLACFLIGVSPLVNLLRNVLFYSGVSLLIAAVLCYWLFMDSRRRAATLNQSPLSFVLLGMATLYYGLSFASTGEFRTNLRVFEFVGAVMFVSLSGNRPEMLRHALWGLLTCSLAVGAAAFPHLDSTADMRLGMMAFEDSQIGNPFAMGMPLAFSILALSLDRGSWLGLAQGRMLRLLLLVPALVLLALSSSRASWLVIVGGLAVGLYVASKQRLTILAWSGVVLAVGIALWQTPLAEPFQKGWDRTFGRQQSINEVSSGRVGQWGMFYHALLDDKSRLLRGYGAGQGRAVQERLSSRVLSADIHLGSTLEFHALLMHVGVEFGLLALVPTVNWLLIALLKSYTGCRMSGLYFPLSCLVGFVLATLTATGFDTVCGVFLGVGLLATRRPILQLQGDALAASKQQSRPKLGNSAQDRRRRPPTRSPRGEHCAN